MTKPTDQASRRGLSRRQILKATAGTAALLAAARLNFPAGAFAQGAGPEVTAAKLGFIALTDASIGFDTALGIAMLAGRFIPIVFVLALAGSLARQRSVPATAGTLPTHTALFVLMLAGVIIIVAGLTFFPALALGPLAEGL